MVKQVPCLHLKAIMMKVRMMMTTRIQIQRLWTDRDQAGPCCSPAGRAVAAAPRRTLARWALTSCACSAPQGSCGRGCRLPPPLGSGSSLRRRGRHLHYDQLVNVNIRRTNSTASESNLFWTGESLIAAQEPVCIFCCCPPLSNVYAKHQNFIWVILSNLRYLQVQHFSSATFCDFGRQVYFLRIEIITCAVLKIGTHFHCKHRTKNYQGLFYTLSMFNFFDYCCTLWYRFPEISARKHACTYFSENRPFSHVIAGWTQV